MVIVGAFGVLAGRGLQPSGKLKNKGPEGPLIGQHVVAPEDLNVSHRC